MAKTDTRAGRVIWRFGVSRMTIYRAWADPTGERRPYLAGAVDQPGVGLQPGEAERAGLEPAGVDHAVERRPVFGKDDGAVEPAGAHRQDAREAGVGGGEVGLDPLRHAGGSEGQDSDPERLE